MAALREHRVALVIGHHPERPFQTHEITVDWTYLRFHYGGHGRGGCYSKRELETWRRRVAAWRARTEVFALLQQRLEGLRAPEREAAERGAR